MKLSEFMEGFGPATNSPANPIEGYRLNMVMQLSWSRHPDESDAFIVSLDIVVSRDKPYGVPLDLSDHQEWREAPFVIRSIEQFPRAFRAHMIALQDWLVRYLAGQPA